MPIVYEDRVQGAPRSVFEVPSSTSEVMRETFAQAYEENPIMAVRRYLALREDERTGPRLDAAAARARLKDAGLEADLNVGDGGISEAALATLMDRKRTEKRRQETFGLAEGGVGQGAGRLGIAALTSLVDPVGAALNFVPVVGEARYARMLRGASGLLGRAGVRAGVGAAEGAVGAALAEPFAYAMRTQEQADYDAVDSLLNVTLGGFVGAGLHTTVGSLGDLYANLRGAAPSAEIPRDPSLTGEFKAFETRLADKISENVDGAMAEYAGLKDADGGRILNTDLARELSPDYRADRTRSAAVHEPASWIVKQMYERKLKEAPGPGQDNVVLFTGGGTGAGKSTGLELLGDAGKRAQIIYDTNLNGMASSVKKIDAALAAGKEVAIMYTWRDPVDALLHGALPRAERMGRTVPLDEHAKTHVGGSKTIKELVAKYGNDERVSFSFIDNSHGKGKAKVADLGVIPELEYNRVREDLKQALEGARADGRISEAVYRGTAGTAAEGRSVRRGSGGKPEPQGDGARAVTAAEEVSSASFAEREAALRLATTQAVAGEPINVAPIFGRQESLPLDTEYRAADKAAEETLANPLKESPDELPKTAKELADLAEADARETAKRLGIEAEDADMADVSEAIQKAERWARAAELATVCLVRGG